MFLEYWFLMFLVCSKESAAMRKIFNGNEANITDYPFLVKIMSRTRFRISHCTGSYVHPYWVLSAAHCIPNVRRGGLVIRCCMGAERADKTFCKIVRFAVEAITLRNVDVCMIKLEKPFPIGAEVQIGALPKKNLNLKTISKQTCLAAGWGLTEKNVTSDRLLVAKVQVYDNCAATGELCVRGLTSGPCAGDSGSPLICNRILVGVLSSGTAKVCGTNNVLFFYTRTDVSKWFINGAIDGRFSRNRGSKLKFYLNEACLIMSLIIIYYIDVY